MPALIRKCPPWSQHRQLCLEIQTQSKLIKARRRRWGFLLIRTIVSSFTASNLQRLYDWETPLEGFWKPSHCDKARIFWIFSWLFFSCCLGFSDCPARSRYSSVAWMLQARALSLTHSCRWVVKNPMIRKVQHVEGIPVFLSHNKLVFKLTKIDNGW